MWAQKLTILLLALLGTLTFRMRGVGAFIIFTANINPLIRGSRSSHSMSGDYTGYALLFDCDGVIVETEEMHRVAYNAAFTELGVKLKDGKQAEWSKEYYDVLQNTVGGGKPKMHHYFNNEVKFWPRVNGYAVDTVVGQVSLVDALQNAKVDAYKEIIKGGIECRPGIKELMDSAIANPTLKVGICTAATKGGFYPLIDALLGKERLEKLDVLLVGDDVPHKKPDPLIYDAA